MTGLTDSRSTLFGPVELNMITLPGAEPSAALLEAIAVQVRAGVLRILDFVVIHKGDDGEIEVTEVDFEAPAGGEVELELVLPGLTGDEDLQLLAEALAPGSSAAVAAFELLFAREFTAQLAADGCAVVTTERIPAPVVNALVEMADEA